MFSSNQNIYLIYISMDLHCLSDRNNRHLKKISKRITKNHIFLCIFDIMYSKCHKTHRKKSNQKHQM